MSQTLFDRPWPKWEELQEQISFDVHSWPAKLSAGQGGSCFAHHSEMSVYYTISPDTATFLQVAETLYCRYPMFC